MSRADLDDLDEGHCFPRVSGDEPDKIVQINGTTLFSPRERG